jgi:hypothetical protein
MRQTTFADTQSFNFRDFAKYWILNFCFERVANSFIQALECTDFQFGAAFPSCD